MQKPNNEIIELFKQITKFSISACKILAYAYENKVRLNSSEMMIIANKSYKDIDNIINRELKNVINIDSSLTPVYYTKEVKTITQKCKNDMKLMYQTEVIIPFRQLRKPSYNNLKPNVRSELMKQECKQDGIIENHIIESRIFNYNLYHALRKAYQLKIKSFPREYELKKVTTNLRNNKLYWFNFDKIIGE